MLNSKLKITVILPVYNVENYLVDCLESVLSQSYNNYELIAVNDGSTDKSKKILESYIDKFSGKLKIYNQSNSGLSCARNSGLDVASGDIVYFLDSDDWILSNTLQDCVGFFENDDTDLVLFDGKAFCDGMSEDNLNRYNYIRSLPNSHYRDGKVFHDSIVKGTYVVQSCCYFYRRASFPNLRFIPKILHEDNYFTTCLLLGAKNIKVSQNQYFQRRIRENSITTSRLKFKHAEGYYVTTEKLLEQIKFDGVTEYSLNIYLNRLLRKGFSIEKEVKGKMSIFRRIDLYRNYSSVLNIKSSLWLFLPSAMLLVSKMKNKNRSGHG